MRLASFRGPGGEIRTGAVVDDRLIDLTERIAALPIPPERRAEMARRAIPEPPSGMLRLLHAGEAAIAEIAGAGGAARESAALGDVTLLAPVPRPGKIVAVGRNYADHAKETGIDPFEKPRIIAKLSSSVVGPGAVVRRPPDVAKLDFEAELAVVIGAFASAVPLSRALEVVGGYTLLNDLSAREFQFDITPPQTTFAKSMDGFCPMGPFLATRDEIPDPQRLELDCFVNGTRMQHGRTADMLFPVARLIEYVSRFMTLEPGDVIATGTPAGIGAFRKPPVWLQPGDVVRVKCQALGVLETRIA
jgi:2-keto-4-pentenoate hydratase/2-oxohepta-3-ene-1,7-dioic acid hydratase in catechol pathway